MSGAGKETSDPLDRTNIGFTSGDVPSRSGVTLHDHNAHFGELSASLVALASEIGPALPSGTTTLAAIQWLDALISRLENHTKRVYGFSLDAVITDLSLQFTLDSVLMRAASGSALLDAVLQASRSGLVTLDAVTLRPQVGSFTLDSYLATLPNLSFVLDAVLRDVRSGTLSLDAVLFLSRAASATLDAILHQVRAGSLSLDAVTMKTASGTMTLDAVLRAVGYSFTLDAQIQKTGIVRPTSDVTTSGTINRSSGTVTWSLIDETPNSNADYVDVDSASGYFIVQCASLGLSGNYIQKVVVDWRGTNSAPSSAFRTAIRNPSTGTVYESSGSIGTTIPQNATSATHTYTSRPWGGSWTDTDVNQLQIGGHAAGSGPYNNRTGSMWATIYYQ